MLGLPGLPEMRQVWLELPYLLQVWYILTILAASMVNRAQLAASLAALFRQYQLGAFLAALFQQHYGYKIDFIYFEKEIETIRELVLLIPYITFF